MQKCTPQSKRIVKDTNIKINSLMINNLARSRKCQETWNKSFIPTESVTEPTQVEVELLPQQGAHFHPRQGYSAVQKYASML